MTIDNRLHRQTSSTRTPTKLARTSNRPPITSSEEPIVMHTLSQLVKSANLLVLRHRHAVDGLRLNATIGSCLFALTVVFAAGLAQAQELPTPANTQAPAANDTQAAAANDKEKKTGTVEPATDAQKVPARVDEVALHRPGLLPDRIVLTWNGDPAKSQCVTWRTDTSVTKAFAEITIAEGGPTFEKKAKRIPATTQRLDTDTNSAHCHTVTFSELTPATKYIYRVGDGTNWSEWIQFRTAHTEAEPFSFIYFGDAQNNLRQHWSRVIREAYSDAPKARFMIHTGDLVNNSLRDAEWGEWFQAGGWMNAMVPSLPVIGNHEYVKDPKDAAKQIGRAHV